MPPDITPEQNALQQDYSMRCNCGCSLTTITIHVVNGNDATLDVAKAVICRHCHYILKGWLLPMGKQLNISGKNIRACLKATRNGNLYNITELHAGKPKFFAVPAKMEKMIQKIENDAKQNIKYDPDKFLEPECQELPL